MNEEIDVDEVLKVAEWRGNLEKTEYFALPFSLLQPRKDSVFEFEPSKFPYEISLEKGMKCSFAECAGKLEQPPSSSASVRHSDRGSELSCSSDVKVVIMCRAKTNFFCKFESYDEVRSPTPNWLNNKNRKMVFAKAYFLSYSSHYSAEVGNLKKLAEADQRQKWVPLLSFFRSFQTMKLPTIITLHFIASYVYNYPICCYIALH